MSEPTDVEQAKSALEQTCYVIETGLRRIGKDECQVSVSMDDVRRIRLLLSECEHLSRQVEELTDKLQTWSDWDAMLNMELSKRLGKGTTDSLIHTLLQQVEELTRELRNAQNEAAQVRRHYLHEKVEREKAEAALAGEPVILSEWEKLQAALAAERERSEKLEQMATDVLAELADAERWLSTLDAPTQKQADRRGNVAACFGRIKTTIAVGCLRPAAPQEPKPKESRCGFRFEYRDRALAAEAEAERLKGLILRGGDEFDALVADLMAEAKTVREARHSV